MALRRHQPAPQVTDYDIKQVESNIAEVLDPLLEKPHVAESVYIDRGSDENTIGLTLTHSVENWIEHGLGRSVRGWVVVDIDVPAMVYRATASTADLATYLPLVSTNTAVVKLVVW